MWSEDAQRQIGGSDASGSGSEDEESGSEDEAAGAVSREDRKKEKKARKEAAIARKKAQAVEVGDLPPSDDDDDSDADDGPMPANPNHSKAARDMVGEVTEKTEKLTVGSNRRERESAEAAAAREKYQALHEQGKTDEAKSDLARLRVIREQREAERARKEVCLWTVLPFLRSPPCCVGTDVLTLILFRPRRKRRKPRRRRGRLSGMPRWRPSTPRREGRRNRIGGALVRGPSSGCSVSLSISQHRASIPNSGTQRYPKRTSCPAA